MSATDINILHSEVTGKIIQCFYKVYNSLGIGFSKGIYIHSLSHELGKVGLTNESNKIIEIFYDQVDVGDVAADIVVEQHILLAVHTDNQINPNNGIVLYNKLRSSIYEVGLLLNFGYMPEHQRKICTNDRKTNLS